MKQLALAALAALVMESAAACGGTSTVTIHGTVTPRSTVSDMFGGVRSYANCSLDTPAPGAQVTVTDPSGKVIGSATLRVWGSQTINVSGLTLYTCGMPFTMKNVPSESRYGFQVNGVPGTIWETNVKNVTLKVTGGS